MSLFPVYPDGNCPAIISPLNLYLTPKLPGGVVIDDPSVEAISLLRVLHGLSKHWNCLYDVSNVSLLKGWDDRIIKESCRHFLRALNPNSLDN